MVPHTLVFDHMICCTACPGAVPAFCLRRLRNVRHRADSVWGFLCLPGGSWGRLGPPGVFWCLLRLLVLPGASSSSSSLICVFPLRLIACHGARRRAPCPGVFPCSSRHFLRSAQMGNEMRALRNLFERPCSDDRRLMVCLGHRAVFARLYRWRDGLDAFLVSEGRR